MPSKLRPLGPAWLPLLQQATASLVDGGLDVSAVWPAAADRAAALGRLAQLLDKVATWNARIDLTAARDERELVDLYLCDALVLAVHGARASRAGRWIDVGSGAGAPGLALALLWPGLSMTLVEPRQKRVAFLRTALGSVGDAALLDVVEARSDRIGSFEHDVAISRATFSPEEWLVEGARLARREVVVLLARAAPPVLGGWCVSRVVDYAWPLTAVARQALVYTREAAQTDAASK
jgi:16S rRNA (guanine527-N7)-methyltransferase